MEVLSKLEKEGISIRINQTFRIKHPSKVWSSLPESVKENLRHNLTYLKLSAYGALAKEQFKFNIHPPSLKEYFDKCARRDFPRFAHEDHMSPAMLKRNFNDTEFIFQKGNPIVSEENVVMDDGAVLGLSFGKDSLLSYGIIRELGLPIRLVFFEDTWDVELEHKKKLIKDFEKEFNEKINTVYDDLDNVHSEPCLNEFHSEGVYGSNAMNAYMLMTLPFTYYFKINQIVFGNEQNFNDSIIDYKGTKCFVSYCQSSEWMVEQNKMLDILTGGKVKLVSYVEPIYNIAEIKILFNRYPDIAKYQMSCSHVAYEDKNNRWCQKCPMCSKAFLYIAANNKDPGIVGFTENLFDNQFRHLYPLFNPKPERIYEKPNAVRDEQLLAFLLAYKNNFKGALIDEFREKFYDEAIAREEGLTKRFFGIHESKTIPDKYREQVLKIYQEELGR
ncbi:MAG TPA: hypothetical protein VJ461_06195 [Candidatus Nanoarchaeia archaeon]|nr:hypothetical protein [Candidatus Nanoarchaeia archaeon]